jgi:Arc/MetJ-type ribon-helix-helix transcriptional regulator
MIYGMVKTTVYLPDDLKEELERISAAEGCSEAEFIRDALRRALWNRKAPPPRIPLGERGLGDPTLAERVDELMQGFGAR